MKLKEFDEIDWDCFAGCESDNPMIGDVKVYDEFKWELEGVLIVDGNAVGIHLVNDAMDKEVNFYKNFEDLTREEVIAIVHMWPSEMDAKWLVDQRKFTKETVENDIACVRIGENHG